MRPSRDALNAACRAGRGAFFAFLLTSALFAAPFLAAQEDFGHTHPEGTPPHVHGVSSVLGHTLAAPVVAAVAVLFAVVFVLSLAYTSLVLAPVRTSAHGVRAPPSA